jgi:SOS-response transcriptional repressor LexA
MNDTFGRVRLSDDSMTGAGMNPGDIAVIELHATPAEGESCAAFMSWGELVVRRYRRTRAGDIRLTRDPLGDYAPEYFAPGAVVILGRVVRIEKGGER